MKYFSAVLALLSVAGYANAKCNQNDLFSACEAKINACSAKGADAYDCIIQEFCTCAKERGCEDASETGLTGDYLEKFTGLCDLSANKKQTKPAEAPEDKKGSTKPAPANWAQALQKAAEDETANMMSEQAEYEKLLTKLQTFQEGYDLEQTAESKK